jgi:hypothetical protein
MKKKMALCIGGCGRFTVAGEECRKCARSRKRTGLKRVKRAEKGTPAKGAGSRKRHPTRPGTGTLPKYRKGTM